MFANFFYYISTYLYVYIRLVQFIDSYDPPLKGLQEDLNFVSPRIGEVSFIFMFSFPLSLDMIF